MTKTSFSTEKEKMREARNARIRQDFAEMRKFYPDVADHRLHMKLAEKYGIGTAMIRLICIA